jgi:hypothetical protein
MHNSHSAPKHALGGNSACLDIVRCNISGGSKCDFTVEHAQPSIGRSEEAESWAIAAAGSHPGEPLRGVFRVEASVDDLRNAIDASDLVFYFRELLCIDQVNLVEQHHVGECYLVDDFVHCCAPRFRRMRCSNALLEVHCVYNCSANIDRSVRSLSPFKYS